MIGQVRLRNNHPLNGLDTQQRIKLAQEAMSVERIRDALMGVQASILEYVTTSAKYRMPSAFSHDAARIYRAFGVSRSIGLSLA